MFRRKGMPKSRKLPNVFNKEQLLQLFNNIEDPDVMLGTFLGAFCGLRISEVCNLKKVDIDFSKKHLRVVNGKLPGKTLAGHGKDRVVPIPSKILYLLQVWVSMKNTDYIFESIQNVGAPLTTSQMFRKYKRTLKKANLNIIEKENGSGNKIARYNFHTLRHTYATMLWEKIGDIYAVKQALGHSDLDTTMIYTHISDKVLQQKVNNAFDININSFKETKIIPEIKNGENNPLEILKLRLAKGEIEPDKFILLKKEIVG